MKATSESRFERFGHEMEAVWNEMLSNSRFVRTIQGGDVDKSLYAIYMIETYHYTSRNARNHALIGVHHADDAPYAKFCFERAAQELSYEKMALTDAMSIGLNQSDFVIPKPLRATGNLIAYVFSIASAGSPLQRLGYSYCAEKSYLYINPMIDSMRQSIGLTSPQLTFSIAHAKFDAGRYSEIQGVMERVCKTDDDWENVASAVRKILRLNFAVLEASCEEFLRYRAWQLKRSSVAHSWHEDVAVPIAA